MKFIKYLSGIVITAALTGCTSFLGVKPDKSGNSDIYHIDQLVDLMGNANIYRSGYVWSELIFASDDCDITPYYYVKGGVGDVAYGVAVWNKADYDTPSVEGCTWQGAYEDMFAFNTVLEYLDKVEQTTPATKEMVRGEALFGRAYFHFYALVAFSRYEENAPGIGYKEDTSPTGIPQRETVKYTLDKIAQDIADAETALKAAGRTEFELKRNFRITLPTLYAFKARFELYRGNYPVALDAAEKALTGHSTLLDFKNDPLYEVTNPMNIDILDAQGKPTGKKLPYYEMTQLTNQGSRAVAEYPELYLPHTTDLYFSTWVVPISKGLYDVFDRENDERWKRFYNNNCNVVKVGAIAQGGLKYEDQQNLEPWQYHGYLRFVRSAGSSKIYLLGPTTAEMMLIKAECLARSGKTGDARQVLWALRKTRFTTVESAQQIGGSVQEVLDERRRELTSVFRWYDLKRLNGKENAGITVHKQRFSVVSDKNSPVIPIELVPNDPFYAIPMTQKQTSLMGWENN